MSKIKGIKAKTEKKTVGLAEKFRKDERARVNIRNNTN